VGDELAPAVECHSGTEYAEYPIAFRWQGQRLVVVRIKAQWRTPEGKGFRVCTEDERCFELFYGELYDEWRVNPV